LEKETTAGARDGGIVDDGASRRRRSGPRRRERKMREGWWWERRGLGLEAGRSTPADLAGLGGGRGSRRAGSRGGARKSWAGGVGWGGDNEGRENG
jgi:hypothetical protein